MSTNTNTTKAARHAEQMTITLARLEMSGLRDTGELEKRDGNWFPKFVPCERPVALVWLNEGTETDVEKARRFGASEGYSVLVFPTSERDPIGAAKREIQKGSRECDHVFRSEDIYSSKCIHCGAIRCW